MARGSYRQQTCEAERANTLAVSNDVANFASIAHLRRLKAGEVIFAEGDEAAFCYQVVNGYIKQYATLEDGRRQVSEFHGVGEFFGISEAGQHFQTAEAITESTIRCYPKAAFHRATNSSLELSKFIQEMLIARLQRARERMMLLGRLNAAERVAHFILRLSKDTASTDVQVPMSRQDIADYLGLTVETVCRALAHFKAEGLIRMQSARRMTICSKDGLVGLAGGARSLH